MKQLSFLLKHPFYIEEYCLVVSKRDAVSAAAGVEYNIKSSARKITQKNLHIHNPPLFRKKKKDTKCFSVCMFFTKHSF